MIDHPSWHSQPYSEIVDGDTYRLSGMPAPSEVYDLGGNLGCFAAYAKHLWPGCNVVSVEANPYNFEIYQATAGRLFGVVGINRAIGIGDIYWYDSPSFGGHTYISQSVGYDQDSLRSSGRLCTIGAITLDEVFRIHPPNGKYYVKVDIEGAEQTMFNHEPSNEVLRGSEYFTVELHFFTAQQREIPPGRYPALMGTHGEVIRATLDWCYSFTETHSVDLNLVQNSGMMWARKK